MPNSPSHASPNTNESSVLFNLHELMRIEQERVQSEAAAQEALQRQRQEHERRVRQEAALAQEQAAQVAREQELAHQRTAVELEHARGMALLNVQRELEANERLERQRQEREHARALALIEAQGRASSSGGSLAWLLLGTLLAAALGYFGVLSPMLEGSRAREAQALAQAQQHARELAALRERAARKAEPPVVAEVASAAIQVAQPLVHGVNEKTQRKRSERAKAARAHGLPDEVDVLDSDDDDPLKGL